MKMRWQRLSGSIMALVMVIAMFAAPVPVLAAEGNELIADQLSDGELTGSLEVGNFTITAREDKTVKIDSNTKVAEDGTTFSKRIKMGGSGSVDYRSIHFATSAEAELTVYAMSSSSSSDRALDLYSLDGTLVDTMDAPGAGLNMKTFVVPVGDYYLASPSSGVNVYGVVISGGDDVEVIRLDWAEVTAPAITAVSEAGGKIEVAFDLVTGNDGADKAYVSMFDADGALLSEVLVGKSADVSKKAVFSPKGSDTYIFTVNAMRNKLEEGKMSESVSYDYSLPLTSPVANVVNIGDGDVAVKWTAVEEAVTYEVAYRVIGEEDYETGATTSELEAVVTGLEVDTAYEIIVTAVRGEDTKASDVVTKTVKAEAEREWTFTYFGQSTSESRNTFEMVDEANFVFDLNSCTIKSDGVTIDGKGGKFTTYHDGVSFYYTVIDPETENFVLTATFDVNYINSTPDGQEGFGLLAMDSLGEYGVNSVNHYTNSAGVIATKMEAIIDDVKYSSKDTLGSRFVTGITPEVLAAGDSGIAQNGNSVSSGFSYAEEDLIKTGNSYTLTLKKTNTGYHASIDGSEERILYGVDELLQLDPENIYLGFAVARGCNVTVKDVSLTITDPATDPEAEEEPAKLVSYTKKVDSPSTSAQADYDLVFVSDVPGSLDVVTADGAVIAQDVAVNGQDDTVLSTTLAKGINDYILTFTPVAGYIPGENELLESYDAVAINHQVTYNSYEGSVIYVTPEGTAQGDGSAAAPLDIYTATAYAVAGQTIELAGGTYMMPKKLVIARGNDGTEGSEIILASAEGERAILDFTNADGGMQLWGDYWHVMNIDICHTPGNVKGIQVAGSYNTIELVNAYSNGDTGIQISGTSLEGFDKWPSYNLILNCTSYDNMDPGMNNADGFAAKLTCGEGNVFDGCIAHNNLDDGWDLFAKIESGPIGVVVIKNSVAYANGTLTDGTGNGDGNGFKLGGDGIAVPHKLINSVSFDNNNDGITSNSNPEVIIEDSTSYGNGGQNVALYGKGDVSRAFVVKGLVSVAGGSDDDIKEMPELVSEDNYFYMNGQSVNSAGLVMDDSFFVGTNVDAIPVRSQNGAIAMMGLLMPVSGEVAQVGAFFENDVRSYTVKEGDTLAKIAASVYGDAKKWEALYALNKGAIVNPHMIYVGQVIVY